MRYKAVVFDFDYTLGDGTVPITNAILEALRRMGRLKLPDRETVRRTIGHPLQDAYTMLTGDRDPDRRERFAAIFREVARVIEETVLLPGARELLTELNDAGVKMAVVSTKGERHLKGVTAHLGLAPLFTTLISSDDVPREKPDPAGLLLALERLGVEKHEAIYVGDTVIDAETAFRAGVAFAAVTTGTTPEEDFARWPSVCIARDLDTLGLWLASR